MLAALRRFFAGAPPTRESTLPEQAAIATLERRVNRLEGDQLEVMQEWVRTRDSLARFLKRQGAARRFDRPEELGDDEAEELEIQRQKGML